MPETSPFRESLLELGQKTDVVSPRSHQPYQLKRARFCAYNQTGQRFISNEVELANASEVGFGGCFSSLAAGSGTALWIVPIQSLSATSFSIPVDLLYLDEACDVLATVESFPTACVSSSIARAASILALPEHSILTMGIDAGDRLMLCSLDDMQRYLMRRQFSKFQAVSNLSARDHDTQLHRWEQQLEEVREQMEDQKAAPAPEPPRVEEEKPAPVAIPPQLPRVDVGSPKVSWWRKLLFGESADQRWGARSALPGLVAYFFTGSAPTPHQVRDISTSGLFVLTSERWYQGTYVRLTLTDEREPTAKRSITLHARVVRSADDGVALEFLLHDQDRELRGFASTVDERPGGVSVKELREFVALFKTDS
jgi:hypothetical protein